MTVLLDAGHGGMVQGEYVTPGKRSPKWNDLPQLFEGIQNREIVELIKRKLTAAGIEFLDVVDSEGDVSLKDRIIKANNFFKKDKNCIYVSVHADAAGNGNENHPATGISVFTSPGQTRSDLLATEVFNGLDTTLGNVTKKRTDNTDKDPDKEAHFYVLTNTSCPAILCELGFMTNRKECEMMQTEKWKDDCANGIVAGIINYLKLK